MIYLYWIQEKNTSKRGYQMSVTKNIQLRLSESESQPKVFIWYLQQSNISACLWFSFSKLQVNLKCIKTSNDEFL